MLPEVIDITFGNETVRYFRAPHTAAVPDSEPMCVNLNADNEELIRRIVREELREFFATRIATNEKRAISTRTCLF